MAKQIEHLNEQIAHCERLAFAVFDELTSAYLLAFAAECRKDLDQLNCHPA